VFVERSAGFEALLGDYGALPRVYLPEDYLRDVSGFDVVKTVSAEFLSDDPVGEVRWAQQLAQATGRPDGMIARVAFEDPELERRLDLYESAGRVRCVRQHLGWHSTNPLLRYAPRPGLMADGAWRGGLRALCGRDLVCELEIFAPQLPDFAAAAASCPEIRFVLPLIGWPVDLTSDGRRAWKRALAAVAACDNVAVKIFGLECIFGLDWTVARVRPWILETIELFGPERCMFASHMPLCKLACSFEELYGAYLEIIAGSSTAE
jgi:predicted TIM-barrel fold metal-dependent hydrolase